MTIRFRFRKCDTRPDFRGMQEVTGTVYAVYSYWNDIPTGWVAKAGRQWWAWNAQGQMWTSYAPSRETAADDCMRAKPETFMPR